MQLPRIPALEAEIEKCRTAAEIKETTKNYLEKQGIIRREPGDFGTHLVRLPESAPRPLASVPAAPVQENCSRMIYPHGNDRMEIFGVDESDLDRKERAIRSMYGQR